jgi:hypothetical protein
VDAATTPSRPFLAALASGIVLKIRLMRQNVKRET